MDAVPLTKSEQMSLARSSNSQPKLALRRALWQLRLGYRLHYRLPGWPELVRKRTSPVVSVDGCFWHGCPEHYRRPAANAESWRAKLERNIERDRRANAELNDLRWTALRVCERETVADPERTARTVTAALNAAEARAR